MPDPPPSQWPPVPGTPPKPQPAVFTPAVQAELDAENKAFIAEHPNVPVIKTVPLTGPTKDDM